MARKAIRVPPSPVEAASAGTDAPESVNAPAKVTWLGVDGDPSEENEFMGIVFPKGRAVPVSNPVLIARARANRYFKVA